MDSLNKPISNKSSLDKPSGSLGLKEPLPKQGLTSKSTGEQLLAGQSSAAGSQTLPATGFVTYVESSAEPIITITESKVTSAPIITTGLGSEQRLKGTSPLLSDLERGTLNKPQTQPGYERKLDTKLDQKLEGPSLTRNAGADQLGNAHETSRINVPGPAPYPTAVGTGTFGMGGTEVPALTTYPGSTTGSTAPSLMGEPAPKHQTSVTDKLKEKVHKHEKREKHGELKTEHKHGELKTEHKHKRHSSEKLSREEKKNLSHEEKYALHEQQASIADVEGHGIKAGIEDLKAGYHKTEAETDLKGEGKTKHKHHKHGHKKDAI